MGGAAEAWMTTECADSFHTSQFQIKNPLSFCRVVIQQSQRQRQRMLILLIHQSGDRRASVSALGGQRNNVATKATAVTY